MHCSAECSRGTRLIRFLLLAIMLTPTFYGCAVAPGAQFVDEAGVQVDVQLTDGASLSGRLVSMDSDALAIEHALTKNEYTSVVRKGGEEVVVVAGRTVGRAVEAREFDIVVRERFRHRDVEELRFASRAYVGWGTLVAAALSYALIKVVELD
jgi:hypothetical protein